MRIVGINRLLEFSKKYPAAKKPLLVWQQLIQEKNYKNLVELKLTFPSADYTKPYTIFNIGGNKFRLIVVVTFNSGVVHINQIYTHAEYDNWNKRR